MEMDGLFISYYFGAGGGGILEGSGLCLVWFVVVFFYNFCSAVFLRPALSKL